MTRYQDHRADLDNSKVRTIEDPAGLKQFSQLWAERRRSSRDLPTEVSLIFSIEGGPLEDRWYYHCDGLMRVLSVKHVSTLEIEDASQFNALLDAVE